ncbi:uncharacterized protein TRIADDRAFT_54680 [Trichoplax adhaerens]|uniref:Uncharacterized protein n=1 Tax=Trichoplax adhaerens TaxID=10228 RepID=B3RSP6_TRIAD|nr:predicted protein [Trichoplax adhaerens]EDV26554.1 predicted protein [Trichoplax adhaerens]|eukprot:XP_002110550.1 predicted protein [Trichoplax adhaerens]
MPTGNVNVNLIGGFASYGHTSSTSTADDADIDEELIKRMEYLLLLQSIPSIDCVLFVDRVLMLLSSAILFYDIEMANIHFVLFEVDNRESRVKKLTKKVMKPSHGLQQIEDHKIMTKKLDNDKSKEKTRILPKSSSNRPPKYSKIDGKQLLNHEANDNSAMLQPVEIFEIKQQLMKDGFRLDEATDDEEFDLFPTRVVTQEGSKCSCCTCIIL